MLSTARYNFDNIRTSFFGEDIKKMLTRGGYFLGQSGEAGFPVGAKGE